MSQNRPAPKALIQAVRARGIPEVSRASGLGRSTLYRILAGEPATRKALGKVEETIKGRLRTADEFEATSQRALRRPRKDTAITSWSVETIRAARDAQIRGDFKQAVRLSEMMRTDDALYVAYQNRLAPLSSLGTTLKAAPGERGERVLGRAQTSCIVPQETLKGIGGTIADHGIAIGYVEQDWNDEGTRVNFRLTEWPLEHVKWNPSTERLETTIRDGGPVEPIVHGDGRWVVFKKREVEPWRFDGAILPGAIILASHAEALKDWTAGTNAHGRSRLMGKLPDGVAYQDADGKLTPEAEAFLSMLEDMAEGDISAGLGPSGSEADFIANGSSAWQIFENLVQNREKAAMRIYTGTDAMLGSTGGAPGVDISILFGVSSTIVQGDVQAIQRGLRTGFYEPWTAINEGDSRLAPSFVYLMPDPDEAQSVEQYDKRFVAFMTALAAMRDAGMLITQDVINATAKRYKVDAPTLAPPKVAAPPAVASRAIERAPDGRTGTAEEQDDEE